MSKDITNKDTISFHERLVKSQVLIAKIQFKKDGKNPHFNSNFITLDQILAKAIPVLNENGLFLHQTASKIENGCMNIKTIVTDGICSKKSIVPIPVKNDATPQSIGSAVTYGKRYSLSTLLGISSEVDDDGNSTSLNSDKKTPSKEKPWFNDKQFEASLSKFQGFVNEGLSGVQIVARISSVYRIGKEMEAKLLAHLLTLTKVEPQPQP